MKNACVSTMDTTADASTQTLVHAETQTDKSAVSILLTSLIHTGHYYKQKYNIIN